MLRVSHVAAVLVAGLLLGGCGSVAGGQPSMPAAESASSSSPSRTLLRFSEIHMETPQVGWATAGAVVYRTTDGGDQWVRVFAPPASASLSSTAVASSYPSSDVGVVAVAISEGPNLHVRVYETADGGARWSAHTVAIPSSVGQLLTDGTMQVQFVSPSRGWLLLVSPDNAGSTQGALLATSDGGQQWQLLQRPSVTGTPLFEDVTAVAFAANNWGLATENTVVFDRANVLVTTNGGITWSSIRLALPPTAAETEAVEGAPSLGPDGIALIPVTLEVTPKTQDLLFYMTTNQGATWTSNSWPQPLPLQTVTSPVYSLMPENVLVLGDRWLLVPNGRTTEEYALVFTDPTTLRWRLVSRIPMSVVAAATVLPSGQGWAVNGVHMYRMSRLGLSWSPWVPTLAP